MSIVLRGDGDAADLDRLAGHALDRFAAWASRLTRFDAASELSRLNTAPAGRVAIGPTLTAVLDWARLAEGLTDGLVDVSMLVERLAAEEGDAPGAHGARGAADATPAERGTPAGRRWGLTRGARGAFVSRPAGVRFDLDGVAKGWLADRALALLPGRAAIVDGDGDIAGRVLPGGTWDLGIADPRDASSRLAVVRVHPGALGRPDVAQAFGLATSGTSVHRWRHGTAEAHHLLDPRTRWPAVTDVVQATVLASSARLAEAFAKVAIVAGSAEAFDRLDRPGVAGVLLLTDRGQVLATAEMATWLV